MPDWIMPTVSDIVSACFAHLTSMTVVHLFILGLACWRLTNLLVLDDGPGNILVKIREGGSWLLGAPGGMVAEVFACHYCMSFWTGLMAGVSYMLFPNAAIVFSLPLALSGISGLLQQLTFDRNVSMLTPTGPPDALHD